MTNTTINFSKMHGLGNDFVVIDNTKNTINIKEQTIQNLAHRNFGIGFDQLLMVEKSALKDVDFKYRIFNADGSEVEQCGNGARCFARFVFAKNLTQKQEITVETKSGVITLKIDGENVIVDMGSANFSPKTIIKNHIIQDNYTIAKKTMGLVSMGNPHAILQVDDIEQNIAEIAIKIQNDPQFINGVNVSFVQIIDKNTIKLRVYERGSGETLACGSGACAAMSYLHKQNLINNEVQVILRGGSCIVEKTKDSVLLSGSAKFVFEGSFSTQDF